MAGHVHGATSGRLLWISLGVTVAFVGGEIAFGLRAHSLALLSDAGHNTSDALALGMAAYAIWVSRRPASIGKTFGYHRVAILTALANSSALVFIGVAILAEALYSLRHPHPVAGGLMAGVGLVAVLMNTVIAYWLSGERHNSLNARAAFVHMAGDALSSAAVLAAGLIVKFTNCTLADPIVSILIALFILRSSWEIIVDATNVLMEGTPKNLDVNALVESMRRTPPVVDVHDLHVWTVGDGIHFLSCHVVLPDGATMAENAAVIAALNDRLLHDFQIGHATIQTEMAGVDCSHVHQDAPYCQMEQPENDHGRVCAH